MTPINQVQKWGWLLFLLGAGFVLVWDWLGEPGRPSTTPVMTAPIINDDLNQHRLNAVPPSPRGNWLLQQDFVARHGGLREIELILARNGEPQAEEDGRFTITLLAEDGQLVAEQTLETHLYEHNDTYTLTFPPQFRSEGKKYLLQMSGNETNPLTAWGYDLNVYDAGELTLVAAEGVSLPDTAVVDIRFNTRYQLGWLAALSSLGEMVWPDGVIILLTLLFLPLPGLLLLQIRPLKWPGWDLLAWVGTMFALGTAVWPLLWYGFSLIGGRWSGWLLWLVVIGGWLSVASWRVASSKLASEQMARHLVTLTPCHPITSPPHHLMPPFAWKREHTFLLVLLVIGLLVRLLAVRDLAAPPWVDASRHALITAVMVESGQTISDYGPFLPVERFPYHFGFHTLSASLMLMSNWELPRLLLMLGQLLNAFIPLTVYAAVWLMARRRKAALLAAFLVAIPFFFPAYYATWGRFTQLAAMLIMPLLLAYTWLLVRGAERWRQTWWVIALLAAGLFLIHFRVFLFYVPFVAVLWVMTLGRHGRWLLLSSLSTVILLLPRLIYLVSITEPAKKLGSTIQNYNEFPSAYYNAGWDRYFIWLAGIVLILVFIGFIKRRAWAKLPLLLALWVGLLFVLLAGDYLGLPSTSLVNLNSMYITLFLPLAIFLGVVIDRVWRWLKQSHWILLSLSYVAAGGLLTAVFLFGIQQQINILNPQTVLVQPQDMPALHWLDENLPAEASFVVSSWKWLGETWTGSDGGTWIVPLTGRRSSTPPADYSYDRDLFDTVNPFNETAMAVEDWSAPETAVWLREEGFSHLFVGARGGFLDPAALAKNPYMKMVYGQDGVFVFEIKEEGIE